MMNIYIYILIVLMLFLNSCFFEKIHHFSYNQNHVLIKDNRIVFYSENYLGEYFYSQLNDSTILLINENTNKSLEFYFKKNNSDLKTNLLSNEINLYLEDFTPPKYQFIRKCNTVNLIDDEKVWEYTNYSYIFKNDTIFIKWFNENNKNVYTTEKYYYQCGNIFFKYNKAWYPYIISYKDDSTMILIDYINLTKPKDTIKFIHRNNK